MTPDVRIIGETVKKARILIVEDERITSDHLRRLLTRLGYEVVGIAANGAAALEQLQEAQPSLVVADTASMKHQTNARFGPAGRCSIKAPDGDTYSESARSMPA